MGRNDAIRPGHETDASSDFLLTARQMTAQLTRSVPLAVGAAAYGGVHRSGSESALLVCCCPLANAAP